MGCSVDDCTAKVMAKGWCAKHYKRWRRHGDPLVAGNRRCPNGATPEHRLRYVGWDDSPSGCWVWRGLLDHKGYARVWDGDRVVFAHRLAYRVWVGELADDDCMLHSCDNPPCINPAHLRHGSHQDNMDDMTSKDRVAHGERRPHKLSDADTARLRDEYARGASTQETLARRYGVSQGYVSRLVRRRVRKRDTTVQMVPA